MILNWLPNFFLLCLQIGPVISGIHFDFVKRFTASRSGYDKHEYKEVSGHTASASTLSPKPFASGFFKEIAACAAGGIASEFLTFPLDTIKTRIQARPTSEVIRKIGKKKFLDLQMIVGIYDGVLPALIAATPSAAVFFTSYEAFKAYLTPKIKEEHPEYAPFVHVASALGAEIIQSAVKVPLEVMKQRLQTGVEKSFFSAASGLLSNKRKALTGLDALLLRDLPFYAIEFPLYEFLKLKWSEFKKENIVAWEGCVCGAVAGSVAAAVTTPLDVAKTRLMTAAPGKYTGVFACLKTIATEEGALGLFSGMGPRVAIVTLGGALFFGGYELLAGAIDRKCAGIITDNGNAEQDILIPSHWNEEEEED